MSQEEGAGGGASSIIRPAGGEEPGRDMKEGTEPKGDEEDETNDADHHGTKNNNDEGGAGSSGEDEDGSSSEEEDDDEDQEQQQQRGPSLAEVRAHKMRRNQAMLESLGLVAGGRGLLSGEEGNSAALARAKSKARDSKQKKAGHRRRGMLLPPSSPLSARDEGRRPGGSAASSPSSSELEEERLYAKYPHRGSQIRKLLGLLRPHSPSSPAASDGGGRGVGEHGAPAPIFVTGPPGTGKTGVVFDVLRTLANSSGDEVAWACADCAHLDVPALGEATRALRGQLWDSLAKQQQHRAGFGDHTGTLDPDHDSDNRKDGGGEAPASSRNDENRNRREGETPNAPRASTTPAKQDVAPRSGRKRTPPARGADFSSNLAHASQSSAAARFARDLVGLFAGVRSLGGGNRPLSSAVIVLDRADRLLSLPRVGQLEQPNFLAQLLAIPRTVGLRLTVVAITASRLLEHSRINPLESTIAGTIQPICIRFPAYNTKAMLKDVLQQDHVQALMTGSPLPASGEGPSPFRRAAVASFVDTLVQSMQNATTNVKEIVQAGRRLWPRYIEPLSGPDSIRATIRFARANMAENRLPSSLQSPSPAGPDLAALQREVLSLLDRKLRPALVAAAGRGGSASPSDSDPHSALPPLAKYMLLSAYLCQVNRPERDRQLFSIEGNGKRRRTHAGEDGSAGAGAGGRAAGDQQAPWAHGAQLPRPRAFALERMLSVYSSVVGLCAEPSSPSEHDDDGGGGIARNLGGSAFYDNLACLSDAGLIHEYPSRSPYELFRLSEPKYWTSLSPDEASAMARSLNFPLDSYII